MTDSNSGRPKPASARMTNWIRKGYPRSAPRRGHNYLIALCGLD